MTLLREFFVQNQRVWWLGFRNEKTTPVLWNTPWTFNSSPLKISHPKAKQSSNHHFSGAVLNFGGIPFSPITSTISSGIPINTAKQIITSWSTNNIREPLLTLSYNVSSCFIQLFSIEHLGQGSLKWNQPKLHAHFMHYFLVTSKLPATSASSLLPQNNSSHLTIPLQSQTKKTRVFHVFEFIHGVFFLYFRHVSETAKCCHTGASATFSVLNFQGTKSGSRGGKANTLGVFALPGDSILLMAEILHHLGCMKPYK